MGPRKYRVVLAVGKSGSRAAALQMAYSQYYAGFCNPCSKSTDFSGSTRFEALFALKFRMAFFEEGADSLAAIFRMKAFHLQLDFVIEGFH